MNTDKRCSVNSNILKNVDPITYSITTYLLSVGPASCTCPSPAPCSLAPVAAAAQRSESEVQDPAVGPVGIKHDKTYVLINVLPCYLTDFQEDAPNKTAMHQLLIALHHALTGLPCQLETGLGGVASGEMVLRLRDGREVTITVGDSATDDKKKSSKQT